MKQPGMPVPCAVTMPGLRPPGPRDRPSGRRPIRPRSRVTGSPASAGRRSGLAAWLGAAACVAALAMPVQATAETLEGITARYLAPADDRPDAEVLTDALRAGLHHDGGVLWPDAGFGPLTRALLTLEAAEPPLPHTRIRLRLGEAVTRDHQPVYLVEATRFNLGPARRAEWVAALGEDDVAPAANFGTGPHVTWRFVMRPLRGTSAMLEAAGRTTPDSPGSELCHGASCLDMEPAAEHLTDWPDPEPLADLPFAPPYPATGDGPLSAAAALDLLALRLGQARTDSSDRLHWHGYEAREGVGERPFLEVVIERGLGPEQALDTSLHETHLMDHAVAALFARVQSVPSGNGPLILWNTGALPRTR